MILRILGRGYALLSGMFDVLPRALFEVEVGDRSGSVYTIFACRISLMEPMRVEKGKRG